jgi:hypothetical protein
MTDSGDNIKRVAVEPLQIQEEKITINYEKPAIPDRKPLCERLRKPECVTYTYEYGGKTTLKVFLLNYLCIVLYILGCILIISGYATKDWWIYTPDSPNIHDLSTFSSGIFGNFCSRYRNAIIRRSSDVLQETVADYECNLECTQIIWSNFTGDSYREYCAWSRTSSNYSIIYFGLLILVFLGFLTAASLNCETNMNPSRPRKRKVDPPFSFKSKRTAFLGKFFGLACIVGSIIPITVVCLSFSKPIEYLNNSNMANNQASDYHYTLTSGSSAHAFIAGCVLSWLAILSYFINYIATCWYMIAMALN